MRDTPPSSSACRRASARTWLPSTSVEKTGTLMSSDASRAIISAYSARTRGPFSWSQGPKARRSSVERNEYPRYASSHVCGETRLGSSSWKVRGKRLESWRSNFHAMLRQTVRRMRTPRGRS